MFCAAGVTAQFIAGKATRDAIYLANLDVTSLPAMVVVTAAVSIGLGVLMSKGLQHITPGTFVAMAFVANAVLLIIDWLLVPVMPRTAAVLIYLQISGIGPLLGSGFWLIVTERFDPHTARKRFGQIAGAGTLGGLVGGLIAERVGAGFGVVATLPVLAVGNLYCAWEFRRLAASGSRDVYSIGDVSPDLAPETPRSGLRVLHEASYLRNLALLVLLGTFGAALVDYLFKAHAVIEFDRGESLLRFFAIYYAASSLITFVLQTSASRIALNRLGLGAVTGTPSLAVVAGGIGALAAPGLGSIALVRGAENVFRDGLFSYISSLLRAESHDKALAAARKLYTIDPNSVSTNQQIAAVWSAIYQKAGEADKLKGVMEVLIELRREARAKKDWATSDKIRNQLAKIGIQLKDEKGGAMSWTLS